MTPPGSQVGREDRRRDEQCSPAHAVSFLRTGHRPPSAATSAVLSAWDRHLLTWPTPSESPKLGSGTTCQLLRTSSHLVLMVTLRGSQPSASNRLVLPHEGRQAGAKTTGKVAAEASPTPRAACASSPVSKRPLQARGGWTCCQHGEATFLFVLAGRRSSNCLKKSSPFEVSF